MNFGTTRGWRLALLVVVFGLAGCAGGMEFEPQANHSDGYEGLNRTDDGMYD